VKRSTIGRRAPSPSRATLLLIAVALTLSGCAAPDEGAAQPTKLEPSGSSKSVQASVSDDPWQQNVLDGLWKRIVAEYPDATRPDVEVVRSIAPQEVGDVFASCFEDQGFAAEALPDGGVLPAQVPEEQDEALFIAQYVCTAKYPIAEQYRQPPSEDQLRTLYEYYTGQLSDCLIARGYAIDPSEAPSLATFIETYGKVGAWSPYAIVVESNPTQDQWYETEKACPQSPPGLFGG